MQGPHNIEPKRRPALRIQVWRLARHRAPTTKISTEVIPRLHVWACMCRVLVLVLQCLDTPEASCESNGCRGNVATALHLWQAPLICEGQELSSCFGRHLQILFQHCVTHD